MDDRQQEIADLKARLAALENQDRARPIDDIETEAFGTPGRAASPAFPPSFSKTTRGKLLILGGAAVGVVVLALALGDKSTVPTPLATPLSSGIRAGDYTPLEASGQPGAAASPMNWAVSESEDKITGKTTKVACTTSTNRASLSFPYQDVTADLCIRSAPRTGTNIYVQLNGDGQIICNSYQGCGIHARFDAKSPQRFSGVEAADHSSNIVFIESESRFLAGLKASEQAKLELSFYQNGSQVLEFETAGLEWGAKSPVRGAAEP